MMGGLFPAGREAGSLPALSDFQAFLIDLDGTVYRGAETIPGAAEAVAFLRRRGRRVLFVSNNASQTRRAVARRLERHGVPCAPEDVMTGTYFAARYLAQECPGAKVFVIGESGLCEELAQAGLEPETDPALWQGSAAAVVAADRGFNYWKLNAALQAVRAGARLIATDGDATYPVEGGVIQPGTGSLLAAVEMAAGKTADLIAGKPSDWARRVVLEHLGTPPERCMVIGDRLDSDILFGRQLGGRCLVLSGVTAPHEAPTGDESLWILPSLADLPQAF